ncbi:hypothetical protein DE146DRAFT_670043 [Phaeosphaeria sp. MPI-PUGE-AT-0046c]|nr:hypothetical protein DE146DRAFT_670043 [Phaeosphaeria sp. MPI-PUGE-AT-0046c]
MGESATHCARIEDVNVEDFIRFCEYAYRGDYTTPSWKEVLPETSSLSSNSQQNGDSDPWGLRTFGKKKKGKNGTVAPVPEVDEPMLDEYDGTPTATVAPVQEVDEPILDKFDEIPADPVAPDPSYEAVPISRTPLRTQFNSRAYLNDGGPKAQILQQFETKPNTAVDQDFTPVLLAHARLYCFAHLRLIEPLRALTLEKLHKTLMNFKLFTRRVRDIIELARCAYSNPDLPDRKDDGTIDDLRKLVVEYIVCEIDTIGKCDEYVKYMEEGGEFAGDFWRMVRDYVV